VDASPWYAVEDERLVEILVWDLAEPNASSSRAAHQPAADAPFRVCPNEFIDFYDRALVKVATPAAAMVMPDQQEALEVAVRQEGRDPSAAVRECPLDGVKHTPIDDPRGQALHQGPVQDRGQVVAQVSASTTTRRPCCDHVPVGPSESHPGIQP